MATVDPVRLKSFCFTSGNPAPLHTAAFAKDPLLVRIAAGASVTFDPRCAVPAVKTVQTALYSLALLPEIADINGRAGPSTAGALERFQTSAAILPTGVVDRATVLALDRAMKQQICALNARVTAPGEKRARFHIVADIARASHTRLYVLDKNERPIASFLISPGTTDWPTRGSSFTIDKVTPRPVWTPPDSAWAKGLKQEPPGIGNPKGILALDLGRFGELIHGIPASEAKRLGRAASHGCLRMSGANVLALREHYAEAGTQVSVNRNAAFSAKLSQTFSAIAEKPINAGREYLFGYTRAASSVSARSLPPTDKRKTCRF